MPLKARITNPAFSTSSRQMDSKDAEYNELAYPKEQPGDEPDDVLFNNVYGVRTIELNRPKKLNSLNGSMARKILPRLMEWKKSEMASVVVIAGAGAKAFCAGGDVAALAQQNNTDEGVENSAIYFELEYRLDHVIATYPKPYVAYMDGITMGGGVGLSVHAPFRIATERTVFAMPETTIGFFPDVGASFFLPRLDGATGTYLALTSDRLHGADVLHAGVATHYVESSSLAALTQRLAELRFADDVPYDQRLAEIATTIDEYSTGLPRDKPALLSGDLRRAIDRCFSPLAVEDILAALEREAEGTGDIAAWARKTRDTILERSPTSVRVTRRLLDLGLTWSIAQAFEREAATAARFMRQPDFNEGVSARLLAKPPRTPQWTPAKLADVSNAHVDALVAAAAGDSDPEDRPRLRLVATGPGGGRSSSAAGGSDATGPGGAAYREYPHAHLGLPSEAEVRDLVEGRRSGGSAPLSSFDAVVDAVVAAKNGKPGAADKARDILDRCCEVDDKAAAGGGVKWVQPALGLWAKAKHEYRANSPSS